MAQRTKVTGPKEVKEFWQKRANAVADGRHVVEVYTGSNRSHWRRNREKIHYNAMEKPDGPGRNPFFLNNGQEDNMRVILRNGLNLVLRKGRKTAYKKALKSMGQYLVKIYQENIWNQTYQGSHDDLTPEYKKQKRSRTKFVYPMLIATGDMYQSLKSRVKKVS